MLCLLQLNNVAKVKLKLDSLINSFLIAYTLGLISYDIYTGGEIYVYVCLYIILYTYMSTIYCLVYV